MAGNLSVGSVKTLCENIILKNYFWGKSLGQPFDDMKKAAVLIPLVVVDGRLVVWLTKRSQNVRHDKGHICFPGGMFEESDKSEVDTALREAHEEIGLDSHYVDVIGTLVPYINIRNIFVVPVITIVDERFVPKVNSEVEFAFKLPLERFLSSERYESRLYGDLGEILHYFNDQVQGQNVLTYGLTASMLVDVSVAIFQRKPDFDGTKGLFFDIQSPFQRQLNHLSKIGKLKMDDDNYLKVKL